MRNALFVACLLATGCATSGAGAVPEAITFDLPANEDVTVKVTSSDCAHPDYDHKQQVTIDWPDKSKTVFESKTAAVTTDDVPLVSGLARFKTTGQSSLAVTVTVMDHKLDKAGKPIGKWEFVKRTRINTLAADKIVVETEGHPTPSTNDDWDDAVITFSW